MRQSQPGPRTFCTRRYPAAAARCRVCAAKIPVALSLQRARLSREDLMGTVRAVERLGSGRGVLLAVPP